ncbi:Carboxypeptidase [Coniochaeta hoffmannii]|uniref:Carboxypeptidase n=1 Tax=Coniochaeta hoffmannii TaxID=91930 RepID=A0AA38R5V4_9PEZI|nr:Carboxypeptidase [Coniochaeta hoffmannii]
MRLQSFITSLLLTASTVSAHRSLKHAGNNKRLEDLASAAKNVRSEGNHVHGRFTERQASGSKFLTANTTKFAVNGTGIPDVDFDVGESYAGSLPITSNPNDPNQLFWWFFPSPNPAAEKEILIWLNGGPGCSSFEGLLQENGPFLWQYGTYKPVENPWAWNRLTNVIWVEQPVGTGFSTGTPTATSEEDIAAQFKGFWKNFVDTFALQGYKVYIAGESYAGAYVPYIASSFLDEDDATYFDQRGILIYDPVITWDEIQASITVVPFVDYWSGLFPFNDTFRAQIHARADACGYSAWVDKYLAYPPRGHIPMPLPGTDPATGRVRRECSKIYDDIFDAILLLNPCFDIYQVATTCPILWDVLGFPGSLPYLPEGAQIYFDRADVKAAIHAPNVTWEECSSDDVFVGGDSSLPSGITVLPGVIERTNNVIIGHGALDMILLANGTLLGIQNMTWHNATGFQTRPTEPFYVPYHEDESLSTVAAAGVFGTAHTERGLTYVGVDLSGHMVPQYAPSAAYRHLEFLLGRVSSLSSTEPFTTGGAYPQSAQPLGQGTAPQGWSDAAPTCGKRGLRRSVKPLRRK